MSYGIDRGFGYAGSPKPSTVCDIAEEVIRAREKFPGNAHLTVALGEEFGELCQAQLQGKSRKDIKKEATQVAALAIRIIEEGDSALANLTEEQKKP